MPGINRLSVKEAAAAARQAKTLGIPAIAVFPHIDGAKKDAAGTLAHDPDGLVAAREARSRRQRGRKRDRRRVLAQRSLAAVLPRHERVGLGRVLRVARGRR
jgi:delta-aminolevulinic acid dehydratase/porphobilinogen synthase